MGYIHDTHMSQFLAPSQAGFSAGTWTMAVASNVWSNNRTAADAVFTVYIPILIPGNSVDLKGSYLTSIEVMYTVGTAAMDAGPAPTLYKDTLKATAASGSGTLNTAASITTTVDTGHDTDAERLAVDEHRMVITLSTPEWIDNDAAYHLELVCDAAATSVFKYFGAIVNYTTRL